MHFVSVSKLRFLMSEHKENCYHPSVDCNREKNKTKDCKSQFLIVSNKVRGFCSADWALEQGRGCIKTLTLALSVVPEENILVVVEETGRIAKEERIGKDGSQEAFDQSPLLYSKTFSAVSAGSRRRKRRRRIQQTVLLLWWWWWWCSCCQILFVFAVIEEGKRIPGRKKMKEEGERQLCC